MPPAVEDGIDAIVFGDLFLRDIREYRERMLRGTGLEPLFPLWEMPTRDLAREDDPERSAGQDHLRG